MAKRIERIETIFMHCIIIGTKVYDKNNNLIKRFKEQIGSEEDPNFYCKF